jgi:hypothetical protein
MERKAMRFLLLTIFISILSAQNPKPSPGGGGNAGSMVYPGAGVANSTGSAWGTSYSVGVGANNLFQMGGSPGTCNTTTFIRGDAACNLINLATNITGILPAANGGTGGVPTFVTLTDGAIVTWAIGSVTAANAGLTFTVHSGSRTLNLTGIVNGGSYVLWIKQDGTGGEGLTLGSGCTWKVGSGGAGGVTPSTGANVVDILAFTYDGTNCYANFNKNFN